MEASSWGKIKTFFDTRMGLNLPTVEPYNVVEILIIAFFIYTVLAWVKNTKAWNLFKGMLFILVFFILASIFKMSTILWIGQKLVSVALIAVVILFQPEFRDALDRLGRRSWLSALGMKFGKTQALRMSDKTVSDIVRACYEMGAVKTGALIVIEKDTLLSKYISSGIQLDALISTQLLVQIFEKNTPLHDGAVIVRGDRIISATSYLPLSENGSLSKDLGTRHRAAIGASEQCDALVIIVSEETGSVSFTQDGVLHRDVNSTHLTQALKILQHPDGYSQEIAGARRSRRYRGEEE